MEKSESIAALTTAFVLAQAEFEDAKKESTNPHFKSNYADLTNIVAAFKSALNKHELSFAQVSHDAPNCACVETILMHKTGEWMSLGKVSVPVSKMDAQGFGSALTYARRYGFATAFGVCTDDDDGNAAASNAPQESSYNRLPQNGNRGGQSRTPSNYQPSREAASRPRNDPSPQSPQDNHVPRTELQELHHKLTAKINTMPPVTKKDWGQWMQSEYGHNTVVKLSAEDTSRMLEEIGVSEAQSKVSGNAVGKAAREAAGVAFE